MPTKGCELDPIPTKLFKEIASNILPIITRIVNLLLKEGVFANNWKVMIIRPLLKKVGMELITQSYHPVSNLSFLSKLIEVAALDQFNAHCEVYDLIPEYQSAYCKYFSCETAMVKIVNDILWDMEEQKATALTVCDLSVAFDTVSHKILLEVLHNKFGVTGKALEWF